MSIIEDLKRDEGWRASVYQDHLGFWTIGYGFLVDARKNAGVPQHIAEQWLAFLVAHKEAELKGRAPWIEDQPPDVQRALLNMAYQMGVDGLLKFHTTLSRLQVGNRKGAAASALESLWAKQTPERAKRVTDLMRGGPL